MSTPYIEHREMLRGRHIRNLNQRIVVSISRDPKSVNIFKQYPANQGRLKQNKKY